MYWWQKNSQRAENELRAMKVKLSSSSVVRQILPAKYCAACQRWEKDGVVHFVVHVRFLTSMGNSYSAMMVYPCDFPNQIPALFFKTQLRSNCPHVLGNNQICLTGISNNSSITGTNVLDWAKDWFECYDIWCVTGKFPDKNYGVHDLPNKKPVRKKKESWWKEIFK